MMFRVHSTSVMFEPEAWNLSLQRRARNLYTDQRQSLTTFLQAQIVTNQAP